MNTKQLIALATLAVAGSAAMAQDITIVKDDFVSTKTRAEVQAELFEARANHTLPLTAEFDSSVPAPSASTLTREQVRADLRSSPKVRIVA